MTLLPILFVFALASPTPTPTIDSILIDDFERTNLEWKTRQQMNPRQPEYLIRTEQENRFLHGEPAPGWKGNIAYKKFKIDLSKTPILSWKWRVHALPKGGNEGLKGHNDSAASVYVYFRRGLLRRILKYVWSTSRPKGEWLTSSGSSWFWKTQIYILRSGTPIGQWVEERVNLKSGYEAAFGRSPPGKALGIGILTDGDQTNSPAIADYDQFVLLSAAP